MQIVQILYLLQQLNWLHSLWAHRSTSFLALRNQKRIENPFDSSPVDQLIARLRQMTIDRIHTRICDMLVYSNCDETKNARFEFEFRYFNCLTCIFPVRCVWQMKAISYRTQTTFWVWLFIEQNECAFAIGRCDQVVGDVLRKHENPIAKLKLFYGVFTKRFGIHFTFINIVNDEKKKQQLYIRMLQTFIWRQCTAGEMM